jgi:Phage tail tube protein
MPVSGNTRLIYAGKQSAKGTPQTTPTEVFELSGDGALNPNREIITLPETDASSQRADSVVVGASPGGTWTGWLRATQFDLLSEGVMGSISGTTTKTAVPTQALPYYTMFDVIPGVMCTQYNDVRIGSLSLSGESLQGIQYSVEAMALSAILGATNPATPALPTDLKYSYPLVTVTIGGAHPGTHDAFSITVNRNVTLLRGDMGLAAYDSWAGEFDVSGTFRKIYETDADYRKIHGGAAAATTLTTTIFTESLSLLIAESGTKSVEFVSSGIEYRSIAVPVNVDGSPILQTLEFDTVRQATWLNNLSIVTKYA